MAQLVAQTALERRMAEYMAHRAQSRRDHALAGLDDFVCALSSKGESRQDSSSIGDASGGNYRNRNSVLDLRRQRKGSSE